MSADGSIIYAGSTISGSVWKTTGTIKHAATMMQYMTPSITLLTDHGATFAQLPVNVSYSVVALVGVGIPLLAGFPHRLTEPEDLLIRVCLLNRAAQLMANVLLSLAAMLIIPCYPLMEELHGPT